MATSRDENVQLNHAAPAPHDAATTKRQRLPDAAASCRAISRVFDVETLLQGLLAMLDLPSLASLLEVLAVDDSWRGVLGHDHLWKEMLNTHFGGKLPPAERFSDNEELEEEDEQEGVVEGEIQDGEDGEEDEPEHIEILEVDVEMDDDVSLLGDVEEVEDEDDDSDVVLIPRPRAERSVNQGSTRPENAAESVAEARQAGAVAWFDGVPSKKVLDAACSDLKDFLRSAEQLVQFDARVQIIRGDIGEIQTVGVQRVDGLAFPTAAFLRNPHTGAASVIFHRAGQGLADYVPTLGIQLDVGDAIATPAFDAGVDKLIHCEENLNCVAMTSISTGNMGMRVDIAAWFALCAIQRYMRSTDWTATIAIVCFDADVYTAFTKSKTKLMAQFNADALRVIPPLQNRLVKGLAGDLTGSADVCKIVADFSKCLASEYLLPNETIAFSMVSVKEEFTFTNMALIVLEGENATTTRKFVERYDYKDSAIKHVKFESAGHVDRDCEIKFHIGGKSISIDIAKGEQTSAQGIYKVLELLSRAQVANERLWEISTLGMKHASEALYLTENSGQTLHKQSDEATAWLYEAYKRTHPHCYRDVIQTAFSDLRLVDKMAQ
ncbi:hypothetical protein JG687_00014804 [Phytophthora cactorum]|uniref:Macro domain-containing protein n=1 Tax=Phytophthora cactorum TaxID=29920 RepID=A0A8T1U0J6_9STRA|nr:hypothetical protein JG687_00014804 [Phytophthora cactorum]